ncbi:unnamed protein product [Gadus morhua 'NCC']
MKKHTHPSAPDGMYSQLVDEDLPASQFIHDVQRRGAPVRMAPWLWPLAGQYRRATVFLSVLCLVLLVCLIAVATRPSHLRYQRTTQTTAAPVATTTTAAAACPAGWLSFQGSCYRVSRQTANWRGSQRLCQRDGGQLAVILSAQQQGFLWDLLPRGYWNAFWFGLSDQHTEDVWTWVDGTPLVGGFWEEGEPNNHNNEDCGYIVKTLNLERVAVRSWYDAPCYMSLPFICQKVL